MKNHQEYLQTNNLLKEELINAILNNIDDEYDLLVPLEINSERDIVSIHKHNKHVIYKYCEISEYNQPLSKLNTDILIDLYRDVEIYNNCGQYLLKQGFEVLNASYNYCFLKNNITIIVTENGKYQRHVSKKFKQFDTFDELINDMFSF